jgi:hypothetical protein
MSSDEGQEQKPTEQTETKPKAETKPQQNMFMTAQQRVEMTAMPTLNAMIRGILSLTIGVPTQIAFIVIARCAGCVFSMLTAYGDLPSVTSIRNECIKSFTEGMKETQPVIPKSMHGMTATMGADIDLSRLRKT